MSVNHRRLHRRQAHTLGDLTTISLPGIGDEPTSTHDTATTTSVKAQTTSTSEILIPPVEHTFTSTTSQVAAKTSTTQTIQTTQTPQTTSTTAAQVTTTPQTTQAVTPTTTSPQVATTNTTPTTQQTSPVTIATPATSNTNTAASPTAAGTSTGVTTPANTIATTPGVATTAAGVTTGNVVTTIQTVQPTTGTASATVPSLAASASATTSTSSHVSAGTVIGGLVAAGVGIAAIAFAIMLFMRRWRQKRDNEEWSAALARRQSVMLEDDKSTRGNDPWAPRPPTMIERKQDVPLPMPPPQVYNNPSPHDYNDYPQQQQQQQYPQMSFVPGQVMPVNPYVMSPMGYPSTPGTPFTANSSAPFVTSFDQQGIPPQLQPAVAPGQVMRQPSFGSPQLARQPSTGTQVLMSQIPNDPNAHYMDLDRSSVTPFQAAQYAEISRKLHTDENRGSGAPSAISDATMVNDIAVPPTAAKMEEFGNHVPLSPMEEEPLEETHEPPFSPVMPAGPQLVSVNGYADEPDSPTGFDNEMGMAISDVDLEPPSAHAATERIESIPPSLPEHRPFSPVSIPTFENSNANNNASHSSPLAQPENVVTEPEQQQEQPSPQPTERKRPETVYNEDDVYGGF